MGLGRLIRRALTLRSALALRTAEVRWRMPRLAAPRLNRMSLAPDRGHRNTPAERAGSSRDLSRPLPAALSWCTLVVFIAAFGIAFVTLGLPWWMPALYVAMSVVAFAAYGVDKAAARLFDGQQGEIAVLAQSRDRCLADDPVDLLLRE